MRAILAVAALLFVPFMDVTYAQNVPIPPEIKDIKMGASTEAVIAKIKSTGTYTTEPVKKENRTMLVWVRQDIPYYKDIEFQFTEKDRLYLIRFTLNDAARADYHSLKRTVFKDYDFSWERPQKLMLPNREMLLYGPEKGMDLFFVEFTDRNTHEKSFELFNRSISATDRPEPIAIPKKPEPQDPNAETLSEQATKPQVGDNPESAQPPLPGEAPKPSAVEKSESAQPPAPPAEVKEKSGTEKADSPQDPKSDQKPVAQ